MNDKDIKRQAIIHKLDTMCELELDLLAIQLKVSQPELEIAEGCLRIREDIDKRMSEFRNQTKGEV